MMKRSIGLLCLASACAQRPLGLGDGNVGGNNDAGSDGSIGPATATSTLCKHPIVTRLSKRADGTFTGIAFDGDDVIFPSAYDGIASVPKHGGSSHLVSTAFASTVTTLDHHAFFSPYTCDVVTPLGVDCPSWSTVDLDLVTGNKVTFHTKEILLNVVATTHALVGADGHEFVVMNRDDGSIHELPALGAFEVSMPIGAHVFGTDASASLFRLDPETLQVEHFSVDLSYAQFSDGQHVLVGNDTTFTLFDEGGNIVATYAHAEERVDSVAFDDVNIYWGNLEDTQLHVTSRSGGVECSAHVSSYGIDALQIDSDAIYAAIETNHREFQLVRVEK